MLPQLIVIAGPDEGRSFWLNLSEGSASFGRSKNHVEHQINDPRVSRVHFQIEAKQGRLLLTDLNSSAGTCVNGRKVTQHELRVGDVIRVGETQLCLQGEAGEAAPAAPSPPGGRERGEGEPVATTGLPQQLDDLTGHTVAHYQVGPLLAKAASGCLFRAVDTKTKQAVALKVLWPEFSQNDEEMQRFIRAMKTMLPLCHPNLVMLYGAGKAGPFCWMAMEFVEGESLTQVIQRLGTGGQLNWHYALRVAVHISRALNYAQQQQIIHRNITPANILIRKSDNAALLGDLMLAKALEGTLAAAITRPGQLVGELAYMAPERTRGTSEVDHRSDIYGLGATVYALLTGKPPFEGLTLPDTITKIRQAEPKRPRLSQPAIPEAVEAVVLKMLAKKPEDRHQTAAELLANLERLTKLHGVSV